MTAFTVGCALTIVALAALLASEYADSRAGKWVFKPLASTGFLVAAWGAGALDSGYGRWIFLGLVLSFGGDVLLIPKASASFLAGLVSFLLGHVAYAVAFAARGLDPVWVVAAAVPAAVAVWAVLRWLMPHVESKMKGPVYAYVGVITAMVLFAAGTVGAAGRPLILLGALSFYVSDLAVARERFVSHTFWNRAWGLPLYYGAQLVLAATVS